MESQRISEVINKITNKISTVFNDVLSLIKGGKKQVHVSNTGLMKCTYYSVPKFTFLA